jgi:N-acetyl sugar amidotransferase
MNRCRLCVIPDTRPDTPFEDGVCSACRSFARRPRIDWEARLLHFREVIRRAWQDYPSAHPYDCIVASSGGKDSHWQVLKVLELGYRPLVVTASTCMLTPIGRANIDNLARFAPTIEVTPNRTVRAKLNKLGLELVGDISWPEHATIFNAPWSIAAAMQIPVVLYGENPQEAYGGPAGTEDARQMTRRWVSEFGGFLGLRAQDLVGKEDLSADDLRPYTPLDPAAVEAARVQAHFMGAYFEWDSERNATVAAEHGMVQELPCEANWWKAENLDNAMTGLHDHGCYRKYGYGRAAAQLSVDIRNGRMTRERAISIVQGRDGIFPWDYADVAFDDVLDRLQMPEKQLLRVLDRFTNWELFGKIDNARPILKEFL